MGEKKSKWLEHLKAAEISGLKLSAYAAQHQIDVRRLYEAKLAPLAKTVYGGTRICWSGDFGAWWRTKFKRKLDQTEKITKSGVGWGYRSRIQITH